MWCLRCDQQFPAKCVCADRDERMASLAGPEGSHVALTHCSGCGAYYTMCQCPEPKPPREIRNQGRIIGAQR